MKLKKQLLEAIKKRPFLIDTCDKCGYDIKCSYQGGKFGVDFGCDCNGMDPGWVRKSEDFLDIYMFDKEWTDLIQVFVKAVGAEAPAESTDR